MISTVLTDPKQLLNPLGASPCKLKDLIIDVVTSEVIEIPWETSEYKLQSGKSATDKRRKGRIKINLECVWVDKTYGVQDLISSSMTGSGFAPETWRDKYKALKEFADSEDIFTLTIGLDAFPNMTIKNLSMPRDAQRAGYLSCSIALEEMWIVDVDFENVDNSLMPKDESPDDKKTASKKKKSASKKKSNPQPAKEEERGSTLYGMTYGG